MLFINFLFNNQLTNWEISFVGLTLQHNQTVLAQNIKRHLQFAELRKKKEVLLLYKLIN